jgi:hypothetical protein
MRARGASILLAWACVATAAPARAEEDPLSKARAAAVSKLESVATWADANRVAGFRDEVFRRILRLDPDHRRARAGLRYARPPKGGPWVQVADYRTPPNWNVGLLPEGERRATSALAPYRDAVLAVAESDATRRDRLREHLADVMPEDDGVRSALGHVRHEGRWVLPETVVARERRAKLRATARRIRDSVPFERVSPGDARTGKSPEYRSGLWRAYGSAQGDLKHAVVLAAAGDAFCHEVFGTQAAPDGDPTTLVLLEDPDQARSVVQRVRPEMLRDMEGLGSLWLAKGLLAVWHGDPGLRRTTGLRQAIDRHLDAREGRARGWITEGFGQRLCWYVAERHGSYFVRIAGTDRGPSGDEDRTVPDDPAQWLPAAADVLEREGARRLVATLTRSLNGMGGSDLLVAYALAAYLLEARPEAVDPFLDASTTLDDARKTIEQGLGADAESLAWRLKRWISEMP